MNQKRANELNKLVSDIYSNWYRNNDLGITKWNLPFWIYICMRKQKCQYCNKHIMMGELRTVPIAAHIACYMEKFQLSSDFLSQTVNIISEDKRKHNELNEPRTDNNDNK